MIPDGLIVDSFAGGGGASLGIARALGRGPDIAINHDPEAIGMHAVNHPQTLHLSRNIWQVDPLDAVGRRPVALAWFSPDCKHFSKAKGGRPAKRHIRDLPWVVVLWARRVRPKVICLENVEEFRDWGPVDLEGRPCRERKGETFRRWVKELRRLGYRVDWRELRGCDYGAPTIRKRLFVIARCDGRPIVWPEPTHGPGLLPYRTAAECIDWSLPCPSIFLTREEGRELGVKRPLAEATMRRIAKGVVRYVLESSDPFIVPVTHQGDDRVHGIREPLRTVTTAQRGEHALVAPVMASLAHGESGGRRSYPMDDPLRTIHAGGGKHALVAPYLVPRYGERPGQEPRTHACDAPSPTVVPTGNGHSLVAAHLTRFRDEDSGRSLADPAPTVTANSYVKRPGGAPPLGVVAAFLAQHNTGMTGHDAREPLSTIVQKGCTQSVVAAHLLNMKGAERSARGADEPLTTICAGAAHGSLVAAFLQKYYGSGGQWQACADPLHTAPTRDRLGVVTVEVNGESFALVDIGMRMLTARELFRAQGFPDAYRIDFEVNGKPVTKSTQIRLVGNSVCPDVAEAIVRAQFGLKASSDVPMEAAE